MKPIIIESQTEQSSTESLLEQATPDSRENATIQVNPSKIMETGMAFWDSKTLLTAIKLELFTFLGDSQAHAEEIQTSQGLD